MRHSDVGGEEVAVKCGCMQGCCVSARLCVISWRILVQVVASTKINRIRVGAVACQSWVASSGALEGESPPKIMAWGRGDGGCVTMQWRETRLEKWVRLGNSLG